MGLVKEKPFLWWTKGSQRYGISCERICHNVKISIHKQKARTFLGCLQNEVHVISKTNIAMKIVYIEWKQDSVKWRSFHIRHWMA